MIGGAGADTFLFGDGDFGGNAAASADIIKDFSQAEGDRISLSRIDANVTADIAVNEAFSFIGTSAFGNVAGQLRYLITSSGNTLVEGDTNGDGMADFALFLSGAVTLANGDFIL
jgi:serralysin